MRNYIPDLNPFDLAPPPTWFLVDLYAYDQDAVIVPSRMEPRFRLTRRHKNAPRLLDNGRVTHPLVSVQPAPDTIMCAEHGLIPCFSFDSSYGWALLLDEMVARDMWRVGGADKAADILENREKETQLQTRKQISDDNFGAAEDMFIRFQYHRGARVSLASPLLKDVKPPTVGMSPQNRPLLGAPDPPPKVVSG